jgi:hypothetical protein
MSERIGTKKFQSVVAPVNPQLHDEFVALCALYHSGDISEEEWALLQIHMAYCDSCHEKFQQYQQIASDLIPAMAAVAGSDSESASDDSGSSLDVAERRLMDRLNSIPASKEIPNKRTPPRRTVALLIAAGIATIACTATIYFVQGRKSSVAQNTLAVRSQTSQKAPPSLDEAEELQSLKRTQNQAAGFEKRLAASEEKLNQSDSALASLRKQMETEQTERKQLSEDRESLNAQLTASQAEAASLRESLSSANSGSAQQAVRVETLEGTVHELRVALNEKDLVISEKNRMLDLDQEFFARDRDIRDLIGARNLYIADISDTTEDGRTAKQFGRIFYTKDRSLVFYGFDLDSQAGRKQDVSFQVWGSGSDRSTPVNLGLFYQDDTHKRWVLRCTDAKTLARLNMVFVTVEPQGGSAKPTGKQLLRAYLQIQPNHP